MHNVQNMSIHKSLAYIPTFPPPHPLSAAPSKYNKTYTEPTYTNALYDPISALPSLLRDPNSPYAIGVLILGNAIYFSVPLFDQILIFIQWLMWIYV